MSSAEVTRPSKITVTAQRPTTKIVGVTSVVGPAGPEGPEGPAGPTGDEHVEDLIHDHVVDPTPHPAYDDLPDYALLFKNGLV